MIKSKRQMFIVIGVFALVMMLGTVTYAFFNYTRTGAANNIKTGRIYFNADSGNNTVTLSDLFPISLEENETVTSNTPGVGSLKLHITGDTTYTDGVEYLIEAVEVTGNGQTALPISIDISYAATEAEQNQPTNDIGQVDENYFTNRGGSTSRYKLLSTGSISEGEDILVGYIAPGNTGIDGELTILAYLDADNIAITDTYPEGTKREVVTGYSTSACETALTGDATAQALCSNEDDLQGALDNNDLTNNQITALLNAGVITEYTDGTTSEWVHGRTVFTTEEWNALQATGVSFKIKATAQEGTWVPKPIPTIPSCPGCKFMYTTNSYSYGPNGTLIEDIEETIYDDYNDAITQDRNIFVGFTESNNRIDKAYACIVKKIAPNAGTPFCLEGNSSGLALDNTSNVNLITSIFGTTDSSNGNGCYYNDINNEWSCNDGIKGDHASAGSIDVFSPTINVHYGYDFYLCNDGTMNCN